MQKDQAGILAKLDASAPHEVMLVVDAGNGQNALNQASAVQRGCHHQRHNADEAGRHRQGRHYFRHRQQLGIPIRFVGVGEAIEDLRPFDAGEFVDALFDNSSD